MKLRYVVAAVLVLPLAVGALGGGGQTPLIGGSGTGTGQTGVGVGPAAAATCVSAEEAAQVGLNAEQAQIASAGIEAANRAGVGTRGAEIIVSAGLVESELKNLNYGDRDSLGWLQQRPSQGWRNARDPAKAADDFFAAMNRVANWQLMDPGAVAQKVQRSAFPARYAERMPEARNIVATLTGATCPTTVPVSSGTSGVVLAWAQKRVGNAYVLGANGPGAWDCSSFSRTAYAQVGVKMPRTAQAQRDWCAAGNCARVPEGSEQPGDLIFWDSYLGPSKVGHVALVRDPSSRGTVDARSSDKGVINGTYPTSDRKSILEFWRPKVGATT